LRRETNNVTTLFSDANDKNSSYSIKSD